MLRPGFECSLLIQAAVRHVIAAGIPKAAIHAVDLYVEVKSLADELLRGGLAENQRSRIKDMLSEYGLLDEVGIVPHAPFLAKSTRHILTQQQKYLGQRGDGQHKLEIFASPEMKESWTRSIVSAACFQELTRDMQNHMKKISEGTGEFVKAS